MRHLGETKYPKLQDSRAGERQGSNSTKIRAVQSQTVQLPGKIFVAAGFVFLKFLSWKLQFAHSTLQLKVSTPAMNTKHMQQPANNKVSPARCKRCLPHCRGSKLLFLGSRSESASLVHSVPAVAAKKLPFSGWQRHSDLVLLLLGKRQSKC